MKKRLKKPVPKPAESSQELQAALLAELNALPAPSRQVLELTYQTEMTAEDIGNILGISANAVTTLRLRAMRRLKDHLERRGTHVFVPPTNVPEIRTKARALRAAAHAFALIEVVVPKRICSEEIGDALEVIERLLIEGRPVWQIYVKLIATVFWILAHAARDVVKGPAGQKTPARKR